MTVAIVGGFGQLGTALQHTLGESGIPLSHADCDLLRFEDAQLMLDRVNPQTIINCAAYNFVDQAEQESEAAYALNRDATARLAEYCEQREIVLVHVSTDYVFGEQNLGWDPFRKPFSEQITPIPDSVYGASKLAGEQAVRSGCARHFVLRTCGLYGQRLSKGKGNFVETMLRLGAERDEVNVVDDQHCTPTSASDLAKAIAALLETDQFGLYHATNSGETTWCKFAREIFRLADADVRVLPITSEQYGAPAPRPHFSRLDCHKLTQTLGWEMPAWKDALACFMSARDR